MLKGFPMNASKRRIAYSPFGSIKEQVQNNPPFLKNIVFIKFVAFQELTKDNQRVN